jgi:ABC-type multidrug transport system fused ATPase/permease subunit
MTDSGAAAPPAEQLPPLWRAGRQQYLTLLILTGFAQAAAAGIGAHVLLRTLGKGPQNHEGLLLALLVAAALVVGGLRMAERVLSERLGQHYIHEIRVGLVQRNLTDGLVSNLGVAITRTSNDLTSIKNWISMGIAPLAVDLPLVAGGLAVLWLISPWFAFALLMPLAVLTVTVAFLTPVLYRRTRALRSARGRLSGQIADTILATRSIRAGGGSVRELHRIDRFSERMVATAIDKATYAGALRGTAAATTGLATALVVLASIHARLPPASTATALTVLGFLASPIHDLGDIVEYRQAYRAARRMIAPALARFTAADQPAGRGVAPDSRGPDVSAGAVTAVGLTRLDGAPLPTLVALPGERILVEVGDRAETTWLLDQFAGLRRGAGVVVVDGTAVATASHGRRRRLIGYAAHGLLLGRGTITSAVLYRAPDAPAGRAEEMLGMVGLSARMAALPRGRQTVLRQGGQPLTLPERARVQLGRALLNTPPVLILDHLDDDLGADGRATLGRILGGYQGVVLIASDHPDIVAPTQMWQADDEERAGSVTSGAAGMTR